MLTINTSGVYLLNGIDIVKDNPEQRRNFPKPVLARQGTISYKILAAHSSSTDMLQLKFDALASHDITFVNIIQTAKAIGLDFFPVPYILTNCHNSLAAVGGTINEDDHRFGLSAAIKYGGIFVPSHLAVIHSFIREKYSACGAMILGSDSHTRYGCFGTMGVGEGGGELVNQLVGQPYFMSYPRIIAVYLKGTVQPGVGPQDVALALIKAVFKEGIAKNAVLEFVGPGIKDLSVDFRASVDVMTTETTCWSSIWQTDDVIRNYFIIHGRSEAYRQLQPAPVSYYDGLIEVDLSTIKPMIALPFHPANVYELDTVIEHAKDIFHTIEKEAQTILASDVTSFNLVNKVDSMGRVKIDQAVISGCAGGTFDSIMAAVNILDDNAHDSNDCPLSVYPGSQPILLECSRNGALSRLIMKGCVVRTAFCGPCFGAGDVPANNSLSIRHTTRNFPYREGAKPSDSQVAAVALMDSKSIAATVRNRGYLTSAQTYLSKGEAQVPPYRFDDSPYRVRLYNGFGAAKPAETLKYGPNINDWPPIPALGKHLLIKIISIINDPVTTTDELIPSGETSSYRSDPLKLAEFTLSRKDPLYVRRAKAVQQASLAELEMVMERICWIDGVNASDVQLGSAIFARKPGDGSAREQAASCQRVLGGCANFANEYATKRYRSNLINWGMIPFTLEGKPPFDIGDYVFIPNIVDSLCDESSSQFPAYIITSDKLHKTVLDHPVLTVRERDIILAGCLINFMRHTDKSAAHC
ncbi:MAG: hydratase [Treponema sp.]|jgi:aconitate hydratase|nr:hydratase [Treponema sp.]